MYTQKKKMSLRVPRNEMSDVIRKHQDISKYGVATNRGKTDILNNSNISSGSFPTVDPQSLRDTSGSVPEFIRNVANFIEKRNPFTEGQHEDSGNRKDVDFNSGNSIGLSAIPRRTKQERKSERNENEVKKWEGNSFNNTPIWKENTQQCEYEHPKKLRFSNSDLTRDTSDCHETERRRKSSQSRTRPSTPMISFISDSNDIIRKRPSDVPLGKAQKNSKRSSTSSLPKSFKEADSFASFFPNFDSLDFLSDFQMTFNLDLDDESCCLERRQSNPTLTSKGKEMGCLHDDTLRIDQLLPDTHSRGESESPNANDVENKILSPSFTVVSKLETLLKENLKMKVRNKNSKTFLKCLKDKSKKKSELRSNSKECKIEFKSKPKNPENRETIGKKSQEKLKKVIEKKIMDSSKPKTAAKKKPWVSAFSKVESLKKDENHSLKKLMLKGQKLAEITGNTREKDVGKLMFLRQKKLEKSKTAKTSDENPSNREYLISCNSEEKDIQLKTVSHSNSNPVIPEKIETEKTVTSRIKETEQDNEWSVRSLLSIKTHSQVSLSNNEMETPKETLRDIPKETSMRTPEMVQHDLIVKGRSLKCAQQDEPPKKSEEPDQLGVKKHLRIDLRPLEDVNQITAEGTPGKQFKSVTFAMDEEIVRKEPIREITCWKEKNFYEKTEKALPLDNSEFRKKLIEIQDSSSVSQKPKKKEKIRDRPSSRSRFDPDLKRHNKVKFDARLRSGLTKSLNREDLRDTLEDTALLRLRRRTSEPISFRGFIWKYADRPIPKDHKASVSSMTSSLRHLNTDELDDFVLWEAVPQKMTCWWEMTLYNCKRTWSVLSFTVFKDNRKSNTPGVILENLKNGTAPRTRESQRIPKDRGTCRKENPFDVEPSIAQKNIDIRNWLAALNFPTPPSTSTEIITEGNFSVQPKIDAIIIPKVGAKRRKPLSTFMYSEDRCNDSRKWKKRDSERVPEIIRGKSGELLPQEQFICQSLTHRPFLLPHSKSAEKSNLLNLFARPKKHKSLEMTQPSEVLWCLDPSTETFSVLNSNRQEKANKGVMTGRSSENFVKGELNFWKYLFLVTLFMIVAHYCFLTSYTYRL